MKWKFWEKNEASRETSLTVLATEDAEAAIMSILRPNAATGRPLRTPAPSSQEVGAGTPPLSSSSSSFVDTLGPSSLKPLRSPSTSSPLSSSSSSEKRTAGPSDAPAAAAASTSTTRTSTAPLDWRQFSAPPLAGYKLTAEGLVDVTVQPPLLMDRLQLRRLIDGSAAFEAKAKYELDATSGAHLSLSTRRRAEPLISIACIAAGAYLLLWKAPGRVVGSIPRDSVFMRALRSSTSWGVTSGRSGRWLEELSQRHRWLLQASTEANFLTMVGGALLLGVGCVTLDWTENPHIQSDDGKIGTNTVAYQHHTEAVLKWLWAVYFHHPAYVAAVGDGIQGGLSSSLAKR